MSGGDMNAIFEALAVLAKQCREQAAEIANLKSIVRLHDERIDAQGMLLAPPHKSAVVRHYTAQLDRIGEAA